MNLTSILQRLAFNNVKEDGKWVKFSCPLAPYSKAHNYNEDSNPSAGATITENGEVVWNCFCCGGKGTLHKLIHTLSSKNNKDYSSILDDLDLGTFYPEFDSIYVAEQPEPLIEIPKFLYESVFSELSNEAVNYLISRGIDPAITNKLNLRYSDVHKRIIFPYMRGNKIYGYSGRSILPNPKLKIVNSVFPKSKLFLGEHLWNNNTTILVEGLFAYAKLIQCNLGGYDVAAISGTAMSPEQYNILFNKDKPIILFLDGDSAGVQASHKIKNKTKYELPTYSVIYKDKTDIDLLTTEEIQSMLHEVELVT